MTEALNGIITACTPMEELRSEMMQIWGIYYTARLHETKIDVKYEPASDKTAIKVTLTSEGNSFLFDSVRGGWVESFNGIRYEDTNGDIYYIPNGPTASPAVVYIPLKYYYENQGVFEFQICDSYGNQFEQKIEISFDMNEKYGKPVEISDAFIDAALKKEFGEGYTDFDLAKIQAMYIHYYSSGNTVSKGEMGYHTPIITWIYYQWADSMGQNTSTYMYDHLFEENYEGDFPMNIKEDILKFSGLKEIRIYGPGITTRSLFTIKELSDIWSGYPLN